MESDCNASGPLKIFYRAATKVMVNFVVKIKVLCSKQFWREYILGGSLCLLAEPRATSGALYLARELEDSPDRQRACAFYCKVGLQDSWSA